MQKIIPFLCFEDGKAEEAANFYISIFKNSKIVNTMRYGETGPGPAGSVMSITFQLEGQDFYALNGNPQFKFTEALSLFVQCETQEEVDELWEKLSEGGVELGPGWVKDKFGLAWQIVPTILGEYLSDPDKEKSQSVMQADAFTSLLDSLNIEKIAVVGYSAGSASAIQFVLRHPEHVSGLVLVSPAAPGKGPIMAKPIFDIFFRNDFIYWATITYFGSWVQDAWIGVPNGFTLTPEYEAEVRDLLFRLLPVSERVNGEPFRYLHVIS